MSRTSPLVNLSAEDQGQLKEWESAHSTPQQVALRCGLVLAAAAGRPDLEIASTYEVNRHTAALWRGRVNTAGIGAVWEIQTGRGRKPKYGVEKRDAVIAATLETKPKGMTHWSCRSMAKAQGMSKNTVNRIWQSAYRLTHNSFDSMRQQREYLQLLEKGICAIESAVDAFNRVQGEYKTESCLLLMANAWELLAKAVLVRNHESILKDKHGNTITAEVAVARLNRFGFLDEIQEDCIQQIISLRNCAAHHILPQLPEEIVHHLFFFGCKFFREIVSKVFPSYSKKLNANYLSLSFSDLTTYADKVQKMVSRVKKSSRDRKLVWLLERGIKFDGGTYITQDQFEQQYRKKKKIMPYLAISDFLRKSEMVRIVPVQAPRNFTADITLRKGAKSDSALPVAIKKTDIESDYPYLTKELADKLGKGHQFVAKTITFLGLKGNNQYHQPVRASSSHFVHRYSQAAYDKLKEFLANRPNFNPWAELKKGKRQ